MVPGHVELVEYPVRLPPPVVLDLGYLALPVVAGEVGPVLVGAVRTLSPAKKNNNVTKFAG